MVAYVFSSIIIAVLGTALVAWGAVLARKAARHQRELARKRTEISSQNELDEFIRQVDQATSDDELNRLEKKDQP